MTVLEEEKEVSQLRETAKRMFNPEDKNPYVFNGKPLKNLQDLKDYLVAFTEREALWVASWIDYLGDHEMAKRIKKHPKKFKSIISDRYKELKRFT